MTGRLSSTEAMSTAAGKPAATDHRIGYVLKVFPRFSETFVINEIRALEALGADLHIFSLHHSPAPVPHGTLCELRAPITFVEDSLPVPEARVPRARRRMAEALAHLAAPRDALFPHGYVRLAIQLAEHVQHLGIRHLHAHFASRAAHVAMLAAALSHCPYSFTAHAKDIYHREVDPNLLRVKMAHAQFVATVTDYNRRYLHGLVADLPDVQPKIVRIYNGVDLQRFSPSAPPRTARPLVLAIGRLVEKKGFPVLVAACATLRTRGVDFVCEIIGGGPEEETLRRQIAAAGLQEHVHLRGIQATEWVAARLREAAVVALPCVRGGDGNVDALPTVLLEAMATARAVVSTYLSGIPEIVVHGTTGLLVPPGDAPALAAALERLLVNPGLAQAMGQAGRVRAERLFDLHANVRELARRLGIAVGGVA